MLAISAFAIAFAAGAEPAPVPVSPAQITIRADQVLNRITQKQKTKSVRERLCR